MIFAICAAACGAMQCILLQSITMRITHVKSGSLLPFLLAKLIIYAGGITLCMTLFRDNIIYIGTGFAAGMVISLMVLVLLGGKGGGENK